jgi:hypothetical protein
MRAGAKRKMGGQPERMRKRGITPYFLRGILVCLGAGCVFLHSTPAQQNQFVSVQTSQQIFAIMCALDAAGFDANSATLDIYPAHAALRARLLQLNGPATLAMRQFYQKHEFATSDETLSPFLSFALVVSPPPDFTFTVAHSDLPPAVTPIGDFTPILQNFYAEAHLNREWAAVQPEAEAEVARLTAPMRQVVFQTSGYLRELMEPSSPRTFTVFVEPLVGNRVDFRNVGDHYAIIVGPGPVLPIDSIRHAFLHFLLDPLTLRYQQVISTRRALLDVADRAPQLPPAYRDDLVGLFDECLVRAAELRLEKLTPDRLEATLHADDRTGFILVRPLYQQLIVFEKSEPAMSFYFPSLVQGINVSAQEQRLANFQFADSSEKVFSGGVSGEAEKASPEDALQQQLVQGDREIAMQDGKGAAATFQSVLNQYPNLPRALYGLAIASVLEGQGQKAEDLFQQIVRSPVSSNSAPAPTPDILAWAHIYLGRISDLRGNREQAQVEYRAALAVSGAPEQARVAAQQGLAAPYGPPKGAQP